MSTQDDRIATIRRAIGVLEAGSPAYVRHVIAKTTAHDHLKRDPDTLRQRLEDATSPDVAGGHRFGAWKIAQQICEAVGLPS